MKDREKEEYEAIEAAKELVSAIQCDLSLFSKVVSSNGRFATAFRNAQAKLAALGIVTLALFGCGKEETPCDPSCGTIRDKRIDFHFMYGSAYRYIIDRDCTGERFTYTGRSSEPYNSLLIGDRICTGDIN